MKRRTKKRQSGQSPAHVSQKRFLQRTKVYVMSNFPFFFLGKFGITDHAKARERNVSETTPGIVFTLFAPTLPFGWEVEQWVHWLYRPLNSPFRRGSGRTEWFIILSPVVGCLTYLASRWLKTPLPKPAYALAFFCPFVWWDGLFWLFVFCLARSAALVAVCLALFYLIAHTNF